MNFGSIILNQSISKIQNYATWIQIALYLILKLKMFIKTLQMMLIQNMQSRDHCLEKKTKK